LSARKSAEVFSWGLGSGGWVLGIVPSPQFRVPSPGAEHLTSQPAENEFQILDQNIGQADFVCCWGSRKTGPYKQPYERLGQPMGKCLNVFRLNILGLGVSDPGLKLRAGSPHFQGGKHGGPAEQYGQSAGRKHHPFDVGVLYRSLEVFRFGNTVIAHHNLVTFAFCALTFAF
jgi:hypothetical protein